MRLARLLQVALAVTVSVASAQGVRISLANEPSKLSEADQATYQLYVKGMWEMREQLATGEFRATQTALMPSNEGRGKGFTKIVGRIQGAFDSKATCYRFDREIEYSPPWPEACALFRYSRNAEHSCIYRGDSIAVLKYESEKATPDVDYEPWDVRAIGLGNHAEHRNFHTFASIRKYYDSLGEPTEVSEMDGVCRVTWTYATFFAKGGGEGPRSRTRLTIDKNQGFAVTLMENLANLPRGSDKWNYLSGTEVGWKQVAGQWVPARVDFIDPRGRIDPKTKDDRYFVEIEWLNVNKPVPERRFTYNGFDLPKGTKVIDMRPKPQVLEKIIGE